jgi:hypothetical protein
VSLLACCAWAADKPNYSGAWKLNTGKSTQDGPADRVLMNTIEQQGATIKVTTTGAPAGDPLPLDGAFQTDGKQRVTRVNGKYRFIKATWETATLVFEITDKDSKKELAKISFYLRESWTLSPDSTVLTKFRRHTTEAGKIIDQKYVFDKQP